MSLRDEIAAECHQAVDRRHHARMLSTNSYIDWLSGQEPQPTQPYAIDRDPCPNCGTRGDLPCKHHEASRPEEIPERKFRGLNRAQHWHKIGGLTQRQERGRR